MIYRFLNKLFIFVILIVLPSSGYPGDVYIAFTANINGALQNCNCGPEPLGGIDRLKTFLDEFKRTNKHSLIIDGGDMLNSYPYPDLNNAVVQAIELLPYDIIVPGDQEFIENKAFTRSFFNTFKAKILLSNSDMIGHGQRLFKFPGISISVSAILAPEVFTFIAKPDTLALRSVEFQKGHEEASGVFRILVYHGRLKDLVPLITDNTVDLVLLAHEQLSEITEIHGIEVIGLSRDAESVAVIHLMNNSGKVVANVDYHAINLELPSDQAITDLIGKFKVKTQNKN